MPQDYTQFYQSYNAYLRNPDQFGQDEIDKLRTQAQRYNIQFTDLSPESTVGSVAGNFWHGLVQGFTTLPVGDKPRNDVEGIAHSLGHLIGFIGGVPGLGTAASLTTKTLIKGGGVLAGRGIAKKAVTKASIGKATIFAEKYVKSVPMGIAEYTMNKVGKTEIAKTLGDFLGHDVLRQAVRHGAHLGVASMVSGAATAIKEEDLLPALGSILEQGAMGFIAGGTFAGIGNIKIPGIKAMTTGDKILKGFAGATVMTIPGALQGATTPENLYNFLIGSYFGASTKPAAIEKAWRFLKTLPADQRAAYETNKDFSNLPKDEQKNVIKVANDFYKPKQAHRSMFDIFKGMGWTTKAIPPASTERLVTVKAGKYRGKSGTTIEDIEGKRTVQIRLEDDTITRLNRKQLIYKDDLLPLEEVEKIRTPDIESKIQEEISALHDFDGSEIITSRPAESLLKKMLGKETFSDEEYVGHLRNLNERISESLEKGSSWKKTKELLLETAQDIRSNLGVKNKEPFVDSDLGQFRQYFIKYNNSINIPRYAFDTETGKFVEQTNFDAKGNRIDTREPVKLINEIAVADGIVTEQSVRSSQAKKVYDKSLAAIEKTDDPLKKLSALQRIRNRVAYDKSDTSDIESIIKPIEKELKSQGYEISDLKGQSYHTGKTLKVVQAVADGTLKQGERIISQVLKPQIMKDGKLVQVAEVVVKEGVRKLTAKEFKQEELKLEKEWAEKEKALNHLGSSKDTIASHKKAHDDYAKRVLEELRVEAPPVKVPAAKKPVVKAPTKEAPYTKDAYFTVKKILRKNNRGKKEQVDLSTDIFKSKEYRNMINSAFDMGYYPYSGKSDSDVLIFMKLNYGNLAAELTRIKTALKKTDPQLLADFNILRTQGLSKTGLGVEGQVLVDRIISGGQKGVDLIGLNVGKDLKITTGGTAPPEWISGRKKEQKLLEGFGLTEGEPDPSTYKKRTIKNIEDADGTVLFGKDRGGTRLTLRMAKELNKPWIMNPTGKELQQWLIRNDIKTLNVAGNQKILNPKTVEDVLRKGLSRDPLEISETAREMYDKMFVSNIKWWEAQNRLPIETIIANSGKEKTGKAFIGDVIDFNKRQQPLFSSYYRLTRDTFTEDFNYVLINDFVNSKDPNIKKMKLGIQSTDGGVIVRDDVLAAILSDMGLPEGGGFAKPFFNSPGHGGLMIGKLALHAAGKAQSKSMKAKDIHFLIPESVAKQTGMRELVDYNYVQKLPEKEAKRRLSIQAAKELNVLAQIKTGKPSKPYNTVKKGMQKLLSEKKSDLEHGIETRYGKIGWDIKPSDVEKGYWDSTTKRIYTRADKDQDLAGLQEEAARTHLGEFEELANKEAYNDARFRANMKEDESVKIDFLTKENKVKFSLDPDGGFGYDKAMSFDMIYQAVEGVQKKLNLSSNTKIIVNNKYWSKLKKISDILGKPEEEEGIIYKRAGMVKQPDRIGEIIIPKALRGKGLGTRFFKAIKKQRLAKGRKKIDIQVNADDPKALKFWTKMGFKKVGNAVKHLDEGVTTQDMTYDLAPDIKKMGSLVGEQVEFSKNGQKLEATDVKDNYTHQMKPEDVLVSFSTYDKGGEKFAEKQRVYKGIHDVLISASINENHPDIYSEMQEWLGGHIKGKKVAGRYVSNDQLKEYIRKGELDEESLKVIMRNFDDLGIKAVNDAMKNESDAGVAFREKARIKMIREAEEGQEDNIIELLRDGVGRNSIEKQSAAAKYLEVSDGSDAITLMKGPSDFTDRAINSYFIKRILQPKVGNSSKGIMRLKDGELLSRTDPEGNTSRIRTEDDIFFLDDGFKDFPMMGINANGQEAKMTLGEQWGLFRKTKRGVPVRQQMREALEAVVVRTPLDNVSGLANLKFEGFTGRSGRGILLADKVMERLGGADLDIDTAAFYFNVFPKGLKEISKVYKNELKEIQKYADKKYGGLEKLGKDFFTIPSKNKKQTSPMATFDPYSRMFVANTIGNAANKMRGIAVNNRFYIRWLYSQARMNNGTLVDKVQIGQNKGTVFKFIARASEKDLRAKSVSAINVSVDVAKHGALVSPNRLKAVLMDAGFKEIQIWTPDKQKTVIRGIDAMERFFSQPLDILSKDKKNVFSISMYSSVFQKIANANQKFFGWNYTEGRAWTKAERQEAALEHPSIDHSHLKYVADELSQLDYTDSFFNRFGRNINAFDSFMGKVESAIRKNPELLRFVPLHEAGKDKGKPVFTKAYRQGIVKKMNVWARWYFGKGRYNISTERGKKAVAYDDNAWKLFTSQLGDVGPKGNQKKYLDSLRGVQRWQRLRYINNEVSKINDFLSNDLYAYASLKTLNDIGDLYNIPFDMNPTSLSFSKRLIQYAAGIKTNYKKAYKEASTKLDASPGATALDAVARDLAEVKVIMRTVTDEYNKVKPANKPEVTYEGVNAFLEASMLGSIGNTKDLNAYRFAPLFASKGVLRIFSNNYQSIFKYAGDRPSTKQVTDWFLNNPVSQEAEQADSNIRFMDRLDLSFPKEIVDIKLDPEMNLAKNEIINRMKRYPYDRWDPESFVKMIRGMFGVGQISDMTKQDIEGLRNVLRSWQKGRGWFRWFSRGGGKDILRKMSLGTLDGKEVSEGKLKVGIGHWFKTSETVGSDHMLNDFMLVDRRMPVTTTSEGKLERVYADAKVPMSHFDKMVEHTSKMFDLPNQIRSTDEEALQKAISPYRVIKTVNGKDEAIMIARVAVKEMEFEGAIRERDRARNEGFSEERIKSIQRNVDATGGRRAQDQEALDKVLATEYQLGNKILSGREVLDRMKGDLEPYLERVWKEKIRIRPDFGDLVIQKVRADGRQDLDMFKTIKKVLMPLVEPGKIVTKGERKISFSEAKYLWYENALHWHAKETAPETKPMSMKDVESLTAIIGEMTVNTGNPLNPNGEIWFPFKSLILNKNKSYRQTYINSLLRFMKYEGGIDSIIGGTLKELRARPLSTLSSKQRAYMDAIESYFKISENELNAASLSKKEFQQRLGSILGYLETKSTVPYKEGTYYSQYDMDIEFAKGKIDNAFYIKEKVRHDPYTKFRGVGRREGYWPHMDFNLKTLNREVLERFEEIKNSDLSGIEKIEIMESLTRRSTQLVSEGTIPDAGLNDAEANIILGKTLKGDSGLRQLELLGGNRTSGNLMSRKNNFGGYSYTFDVLGDYLWAMNRATYSNISSLLAENTIRSFVKDKPMGKYTQDWEYFMRMYVRDSMGAPSTATDEMLDSKTLKLRNTPWWWLSDQFLFEALPRTRKAFIKMKGLDKATDIQRELFDLKKQLGKVKEPNFERYWDKVKDTLYASRDAEGNIISQNIEFFSGRLRALAQAEGKWALASLLARAKVSVANVLGGGTNTWVYTGAKNIWRARDIGIWRDINPNTDEGAGPVFRSMADVYKWTHRLGVVDEMIMYEAGLMNREYKKGGLASFFNDAAKAIKNDPELKDATLMEIAKKHKVSDALFDKAAWFMRSSERQLRTRTFLASYLQARDSMYPVEFELNDPWLISQGKKGVKATQFFYHAPYRPAFARTSAGKVFNRFKLWSWNSGKFRREVYQEARYLGFKPGTKEFERLQRLVQADAFVIGLAMLLPYTMFDYSLPAPYSYMQNMADWAYGDEKQRERAYFGVLPKAIAPIHEIMPSILRGPEMIFGSLFTGSWDRLASYTLVSYVPFGLFGRDLIKAYQSPSMLTEFITGVPLHRIQRVKQDVEKGKKASPLTPTIW